MSNTNRILFSINFFSCRNTFQKSKKKCLLLFHCLYWYNFAATSGLTTAEWAIFVFTALQPVCHTTNVKLGFAARYMAPIFFFSHVVANRALQLGSWDFNCILGYLKSHGLFKHGNHYAKRSSVFWQCCSLPEHS